MLSRNHNETGKFFGELEGPIMEDMIELEIYQKSHVFDLQGVCFVTYLKASCASIMSTVRHYRYYSIQH
jgi:hypothetical protein